MIWVKAQVYWISHLDFHTDYPSTCNRHRADCCICLAPLAVSEEAPRGVGDCVRAELLVGTVHVLRGGMPAVLLLGWVDESLDLIVSDWSASAGALPTGRLGILLVSVAETLDRGFGVQPVLFSLLVEELKDLHVQVPRQASMFFL